MELKVGNVYEAKRKSTSGLFSRLLNDREILWISADGNRVQYDSPTVKMGQKQPMVDREAFLKWAKRDVTSEMPDNRDWRTG